MLIILCQQLSPSSANSLTIIAINISKPMRIMQLYRIEHDYKFHKQRLQSIQQLNSKQRVAKATSHNFYIANEHKKIRLNAEIFHEKEELSRRQRHNELMYKTISDRSKRIRQQYESTLMNVGTQDRPQRRGEESERIELENNKFREKIEKMKSVYKHTRKNSDLSLPSHRIEREKARQTEKDKLVNMLKTHFKMEPVVSFPRPKAKTNSNDPQLDTPGKAERVSIQKDSVVVQSAESSK